MDKAPRLPARGGSTRVRRFDGRSRRTADWDGFRKDSQLWSDDADCAIHFYAYGTSQRGPSLKVPYAAIEKLGSEHLIHDCLYRSSPPRPTDDRHEMGFNAPLSTIPELDNSTFNIHIPITPDVSREEAFSYHITTRNVIAYAVGKPVVGEKLSVALLHLWERLRAWVPGRPLRSDFTTYLREQGYLNFTENAEHALACLKFAEEARFRDVWTNAFAHCCGMHERLDLSPEFRGVSKRTAALLTRASLEMDLHISRVISALGGFLEEELGPELLGLSKAARDHLDHFRSFLHAYYVDKFGWFPPPRRSTWDKRPWREMHEDFQRLYDYLVDRDSTPDWTSIRANGGICMFQNVQAFDERHGYAPLPHPLALLPVQPTLVRRRSIASQTALRNLKLGRLNSSPGAKITIYQALSIATNNLIDGKGPNALIQQYQRFEHQKLDVKLDLAEGRKVRWLLIYGVLQMLNSIMRGPEEVENASQASYPVCVLVNGCPIMDEDADDDHDSDDQESTQTTPRAAALDPGALDALEGRSSRISIHPDCEADGAEEFFASHTISRQESELSLHQLASSAPGSVPLSRTDSFRNSMQVSVQALHNSLLRGLNKKSSRRTSLPALGELEQKTRMPYCEIVVEDYGNGMVIDGPDRLSRPRTAIHDGGQQTFASSNSVDPLLLFDFGLPSASDEPVLEHSQLEVQTTGLDTPHPGDNSPRDSCFSGTSDDNGDSNRSSYVVDEDSDGTEMSSWDGEEENKRDSLDSSIDSPLELKTDNLKSSIVDTQLCYQPRRQNVTYTPATLSVNAGCYSPTGLLPPPMLKHHFRQESGATIASIASSFYPDDSIQAADIEEESARGRRSTRAMDNLEIKMTEQTTPFAYQRILA